MTKEELDRTLTAAKDWLATWPEWKYGYALPNDVLNVIAVMPPDANDDYASRFVPSDTPQFAHNYSPVIAAGRYTPQPYTIEVLADGQHILYTNQENAMLRYTAYVSDTTVFSPLFTMALSWHLASMLAGPIIKGDQGAAEAKRCTQMAMGYISQAEVSDANQRRITLEHIIARAADDPLDRDQGVGSQGRRQGAKLAKVDIEGRG